MVIHCLMKHFVENMNKIYFGDCLEVLKSIENQSIDLILADPPYGTTSCKWDSIIPLDPLWEELKRIIKPNKAIVLFGDEPFSSQLRCSNIEQYKYDWYWKKSRPNGFTNAKLKPLKDIENIMVFSSGNTANGSKTNMPYFPQGLKKCDIDWERPQQYFTDSGVNPTRKSHKLTRKITATNYPRQILEFSNPNNNLHHPTQKPIDLLTYLINTYSNPGESVLDFCMGSGSCGVAAIKAGRFFIGIEKNEHFFNISKNNIKEIDNEVIVNVE